MRIAELEGRRVAIWGFGREGRAVLRVVRQHLPEQELTVLNDGPLGNEARAAVEADPRVRLVIGNACPQLLGEFEIVIKSPGISPYTPAVQRARASGTRFDSATNLWFALPRASATICVTGTKGKSTTASLIAHMLRARGLRVALGGNIGIPLFDLAPTADVTVIEMSSYQTSDFSGHPDVALLLNLFPEHLDWHGSVERYFADKLRLLDQTAPGIEILNRADPESRSQVPPRARQRFFNDPEGFSVGARAIERAGQPVFPIADVPLRGHHNLSNLCAALTAIEALGYDALSSIDAVRSFQALPHRLQVLGELDGLCYVDDSISTTPQSSLAAVETFQPRPVSLLVGGFERGLDFERFAERLARMDVHAVIAMPDSGRRIAEALLDEIRGIRGRVPQVLLSSGLEDAVALARKVTPPGGVVLLSPAAPSYGFFENYAARGDAFLSEAGFCTETAA